MRIAIEIQSCSECPYAKIINTKDFRVDSESGWSCTKNSIEIPCRMGVFETNPSIPNWCPAALETIRTKEENAAADEMCLA